MLTLLYCLVLHMITTHCKDSVVVDLDPNTFAEFKSRPGINLIYFSTNFNKKGDNTYEVFLEEYEKSAVILDAYDVQSGKFDCSAHALEDFCDDPDVGQAVHVFRNGHKLLSLNIEVMFSVDSIVANVLHVVLLKSVPITQDVTSRDEFVGKFRQHFDFFIAYYDAIGTHANRAFLEVAYAYQSRYKFAVSTDKTAVKDLRDFDDSDTTALWYMQCAGLPLDVACTVYKYRDAMELTALARYFNALDFPAYQNLELSGKNPYQELDMHTVVLFYNEKTQAEAEKLRDELTGRFLGMAGVLMIDVDEVEDEARKYGYVPHRTSLPGVGFQYRDEGTVNTMAKGRDPITFVNNHLGRVVKSLTRMREEAANEIGEPYDVDQSRSTEELMAREDSQVAAVVSHFRRRTHAREHLPKLNVTSFSDVTNNSPFIFVLFYLTFDPSSMVTLMHFINASNTLAALPDKPRPLAAIDCFDWTDVCKKADVTSWPTLRVYRKGKPFVTYQGLLSEQAFVNTVQIYKAGSPIEIQSENEYLNFIQGQLPKDIGKYADVSFVGLFNSKDSEEFQLFSKLASEKEGKHIFCYVTGDLAKQISSQESPDSLPQLHVTRMRDPLMSRDRFTGAWTREKLAGFLHRAALNSFPELRVDNLPSLLALKKPLLIMFTESSDHPAYQSLAPLLASLVAFPDVIMCWMDLAHSLSRMLLYEYNPDAVAPALSLVNHAHASIYNYNDVTMTSQAIYSWLQAVQDGTIPSSKSLVENEWRPQYPAYDFLAKIDEDERQRQERLKRRQDLEEDYLSEEDTNEEEDSQEASTRAALVGRLAETHKPRHHHGGEKHAEKHKQASQSLHRTVQHTEL